MLKMTFHSKMKFSFLKMSFFFIKENIPETIKKGLINCFPKDLENSVLNFSIYNIHQMIYNDL